MGKQDSDTTDRPKGWASLQAAPTVSSSSDAPIAHSQAVVDAMSLLADPLPSAGSSVSTPGLPTVGEAFNAVDGAADDLVHKELAVTAARDLLNAKVAAVDEMFARFDVVHRANGDDLVADPTAPTHYRKARVATEDTVIGGSE